ncbi:PREDICTED: pre-mRNA-splicing factor CWC22 homolog isoform X2 [Lupinus angustifolius]|uniref:pre-mRNA-splicing factor CWC22 homolog isoform X2 n=1 Tax=Lupinus angustifolius TaxID=3871 RepID=UPI00092EFBD7|nr:PREDICTED: pre-mRNA-splicing factor CWC22 homolog isoform X2 [Lupinus angustifolius]
MARKHSGESSEEEYVRKHSRKQQNSDSSEDDVRDRYHNRKTSHRRHRYNTDSEGSEEKYRNKAKRDTRIRRDHKDDRGRSVKVLEEEGRKSKQREIKETENSAEENGKSKDRERKDDSQSSEEEGQIVSNRKVREDRGERSLQHRREEAEVDDAPLGIRESYPRSNVDGRQVEKDRHKPRDNRHEIRDRRERHDLEEDDRELVRKSEREGERERRRVRDRERGKDRERERERRSVVGKDGDSDRDRWDKDRSKQSEESRKEENDGHGRRVVENTKQPTIPEGKVNGGDSTNSGKSGGVYIPPFKLARMMKQVEDKSSVEYQRLTWDALRKSINGLVNKVNATNIKNIIPELFAENLIRGRGLFCRSCMKSQMASPGFTDVFAALVAVVNTKFPEVGDLLLRRIILQLKRAYKRNDKPQLLAAVKFIAHLVNQQVAHEIIALELLTVLLEKPTDDSVEVAVGFVTECGSILSDLSPKGLHGIFERFRGILHEGEIDKRVQFLIEGLFAIRKAKFQGYPAVRPELDLVEQEDQLTHEVSLDEEIDPEISLDIFKPDPNFPENEKRYEDLKKTILGEESEDEDGSEAGSDEDDESDDDNESDDEDEESMQIKDETETNLINLRRTIYLTIMSSVDFEEAGHKLLKIKLEPGQEMELCIMLLECCSQERTYLRYYGLLGQRFCMINKVHQENFEKCFVQQYSMIHRLETNKLRNVAKFFAHLLGTDALPWHVLSYIRLTEEDTTSSSRIFIKILFQELSEHLGIRLLNERLNDPTVQESFESIFPKDNPKNTRFCINFFTSIGLGGLTENLREYLKNMPRLIMEQQKQVSESDDDESGKSDSSDSGTSSSESESSSSDESDRKRRKRRRK